jgi:hypothetical protein
MLTPDLIEKVRSRTRVSIMDAMHALSVADGDVDRAITGLNDHAHSGNRAILASTCEHAQRIAAGLVEVGIWFECEATGAGQWRFSVALGAYARLCALNEALLAEMASGV